MHDYINDIHYLLPRPNDLAFGIKKRTIHKKRMALIFLKKGTSHIIIITYLAMKRKETSHNVQKNL